MRWGKVVTVSFYPPVLHIAPSSVTFGDSFPPRGSLRYFGTLELLTTIVFYISPIGFANRLPLGGKVGRPEAGSDEGERQGFHGVGNSPTHPP